MFDTHVNLHGEAYAEDLSDVLARARTIGITRMLAICDRLDNFDSVHDIASNQGDIWCSVGVHPHHSKDFLDLSVEQLVQLSKREKVVAIGETGLDFHYGYSAEDEQIASFRKHIAAARETGLPLIIHTRNADELTGDILEEEYRSGHFLPLLHCYTAGHELLERGLALGAYVSASGIITFKKANDVRDVIKKVPLDRIIVETDCPYLAPTPHRGRRNEPSYLPDVITGLASLHDMPPEHISKITEDNALRLFSRVLS